MCQVARFYMLVGDVVPRCRDDTGTAPIVSRGEREGALKVEGVKGRYFRMGQRF